MKSAQHPPTEPPANRDRVTPDTRAATAAPPATQAQAGDSVGGERAPTAPVDAPASADAPARTFTQEQLDRILARERARFQREITALRAQLPPSAAAADATASGSTAGTAPATQTPAAALRSERAADAVQRLQRDLETRAAEVQTLRQRLQAQAISAAVSSALAGLDWVGPDALELAEARLRALATVEELDGREIVTLRDRDTDLDLADRAAVHAWLRQRFPSLIRAPSGSGAAHGRGNGAPVVDWKTLSPAERIALGIPRR